MNEYDISTNLQINQNGHISFRPGSLDAFGRPHLSVAYNSFILGIYSTTVDAANVIKTVWYLRPYILE